MAVQAGAKPSLREILIYIGKAFLFQEMVRKCLLAFKMVVCICQQMPAQAGAKPSLLETLMQTGHAFWYLEME